MITIVFIIVMSGIISAIRIIQSLHQNHFLVKHSISKFTTLIFLWMLMGVLIFRNHVVAIAAIAILPPICGIFLNLFLLHRRKKFLSEEAVYLVDSLILKMKAGSSLRMSIFDLKSRAKGMRAQILDELNSFVAFSQQSSREKPLDSQLLATFSEIRLADQQPHQALKRLEVVRERLKLVADFRRRSGQVTQQARAQAFVLTGIYFAVLGFVIHSFGWQANHKVFLTSFTMYLVGLVWMFQIGRKLTWRL